MSEGRTGHNSLLNSGFSGIQSVSNTILLLIYLNFASSSDLK
jgi:hypothetical protein